MAAPLVISLEGEYDISSHESLRDALQASYGRRDVVVDFSRVRYLDSTALTELVVCRKRRKALGYPPKRFANLTDGVRLIFRTTRLDQIWPIYGTVQEAIDSFEREHLSS